MKEKIWLSPPHMGGQEKQYVQQAFETNWVAPVGPHIDQFENEVCKYTGAGQAVALSSGTAAIHLALILLGVNKGDEVLVSSLTFAGSVNPIIYQGAIPVLVDSEEETANMCPELLEVAIQDRLRIGKKPKAIILVHLYGMPAQIHKIQQISDKYDIPIIEDAAEALGSSFQERKLGTFGLLGVYSFNGNKIITTSGGGCLISDNPSFIEKAKKLSTQARDPAPHYQHSEIGYNYRLSNICAAIGIGQMEALPLRVDQRRNNFLFYRRQLQSIEYIDFVTEPDDRYFSNHWLTWIKIDPDNPMQVTPELIRTCLAKSNIEARPLWKPMHLQPVFSKSPYYGLGLSDRLFRDSLCLPSGSDLTTSQLNRIVSIIKDCFV